MSRYLSLITLLGLLFIAGARPAQAQDDPRVTLYPLSCTLCETRISPDGKIAAVFENREMAGGEVSSPAQVAITLIDTATGKALGRLSGQSDYTADVAFSPDGRFLAALHANGDLRLWDAKTRKLVWERFIGPGGGRLAFTPDGETIVAGRTGIPQSFWLVDRQSGLVGPVLSWRFDTFSDLMAAVGEANSAIAYTLAAWAIAPDGQQIAAATFNDDVWLFDIASSAASRVITNTQPPGKASIRQLGYTPDGGSIYYGDSSDHSLHLWSLEFMTDTLPAATGDKQEAFDLYGLTLSPDGSTFAWADHNEEAGERGLAQLLAAPVDDWSQPTLRIDLPDNLRAMPLTRVYYTPDGRIIAGGFVALDGENVLVVVEPL